MKALHYGKRGWLLIVISAFTMFYATIGGVALNVIVPKFSELYGWSSTQLLAYATPIGFITAFSCLVFSYFTTKPKGGMRITTVSMLIFIVGISLWGFSTAPWQYFVCFTLVNVGGTGAAFYGLVILLGNWFPVKKGAVIGIVTAGANVGTMLIGWVFTWLWDTVGFRMSFVVLALTIAVPFILLLLFIRETPEQIGCYPDNDPSASLSALSAQKERNAIIDKTSPFTVRRLLHTKEFWTLFLSLSILKMMNQGVNSSVVPATVSFGNNWTWAMSTMTVFSIVAVPSSVVAGFIDTKIGVRKTSILVSLVGTVAMFASIFHGHTWSRILIASTYGFFLGSASNLTTSLLVTYFGRYDFKKALAVMEPAITLLRMLGVSLVAHTLETTGHYETSLAVFGVLSLAAAVMFLCTKEKHLGRTDEDIEKLLQSAD